MRRPLPSTCYNAPMTSKTPRRRHQFERRMLRVVVTLCSIQFAALLVLVVPLWRTEHRQNIITAIFMMVATGVGAYSLYVADRNRRK